MIIEIVTSVQTYTLSAEELCHYEDVDSIPTTSFAIAFSIPFGDMWAEEFTYLIDSFATFNTGMNCGVQDTSFSTSSAALAALLPDLKAALEVYDTWPHSSEGPYTPS